MYLQQTIANPLFPLPKTESSLTVWRFSTTKAVKVRRVERKYRLTLWTKALSWEQNTASANTRRHGGIIGHTALSVFRSLLFDFLNIKSGRCYPSYEAIALKTGYSRAAVAEALKRLKRLGIIDWNRRCRQIQSGFGLIWEQMSNVYHFSCFGGWLGKPFIEETIQTWEVGCVENARYDASGALHAMEQAKRGGSSQRTAYADALEVISYSDDPCEQALHSLFSGIKDRENLTDLRESA